MTLRDDTKETHQTHEQSGGGDRAVNVVKLLADTKAAPRVAMRGTSMTPLLREPMVLKIGPREATDRVGDILVFERNGQLIAHRITALSKGAVQTCGDAVPWSPEYPEREEIVGKVIAVLADDSPDAAQLDSALFRLRGLYKARFRGPRALPFHASVLARRFWRALPWFRARPFVALVQTMSAVVRNDQRAFERGLNLADPSALCAAARRHGCSAALVEAVSALHAQSAGAQYMQRSLQSVGRAVALRGIAVKTQIARVTDLLGRAGVPFVLLKGAARLYRDEPGSTLHGTSDLDILVPAASLETAASALRDRGYAERVDEQRRRDYQDHHHHAAPLFPPDDGCVVELHVALAPPGTLSIALDWEALEPHMIEVNGPAGPVRVLDDVGSALHYAVHSIGLYRLRDTVLLAGILATMQPRRRELLRGLIAKESTDPIRLGAAVLLAARLAGIPWGATGEQEEYLRWCMRREDMPLFFGTRSQLAEGWFAAGRRFTRLSWRLLDPRSGLVSAGNRPAALRLAGRAITGASAYAYALAMRPLQG